MFVGAVLVSVAAQTKGNSNRTATQIKSVFTKISTQIKSQAQKAPPQTDPPQQNPGATLATLPMPGFKRCSSYTDALIALRRVKRQATALYEHSSDCPANTVIGQDPREGTNLLLWRGRITITVSLGPDPTLTPTPTPTPTATPTPTLTPTLSPTQPPTPEIPTPSITPAPSDDRNANQGNGSLGAVTPSVTPTASGTGPVRDIPWGWLLAGVLFPVTGFSVAQLARYQLWKRRIETRVSIDKPVPSRIPRITFAAPPVEMRVRVSPGEVRFQTPSIIRRGDPDD